MKHIYIKGVGVPYSTDREEEAFTPKTDIGNNHIAVFLNHDPAHLFGNVIDKRSGPLGMVFLMSLVIPRQFEFVHEEIKNNRAFLSTGIGDNVPTRKDGVILEWPIVEVSVILPYTDLDQYRSNPANWHTSARITTKWFGKELK